jgi:BirA family biotin operon repressor/biotin-[acetyl-CoA-carboxylase] ligase
MSALGQPFIILDTVGSTNNYAMGQVHAQMTKHGTVYFALEQTAGKGQRSKTWKSEPGQNIILSVVINPGKLKPHQTFFLSAAVAVACREFFVKYAGDDASIKWPNDLYWSDRKAGGILIENLIRGSDWAYAIVGIGININQTQFPEDVKHGVSLKQITGRPFNCQTLAKELCSLIDKWFELLQTGKEEMILNKYREHLYKRGKQLKLKSNNRVFEAEILDVTEEGKLRVRAGEVEEEFGVGEIEFIN